MSCRLTDDGSLPVLGHSDNLTPFASICGRRRNPRRRPTATKKKTKKKKKKKKKTPIQTKNKKKKMEYVRQFSR